MNQASYIFGSTPDRAELERLRAIEAIFDPASHRLLEGTGLQSGWRCLEVGAGAGSIARWLAERVGPAGEVVALDVNTRFLKEPGNEAATVVEGDVCALKLDRARFDLVHARYVLIHLAQYAQALAAMIRCLKPGGWLVLEEPDFSAAQACSPLGPLTKAFDRVNRAIQRMFDARGMDYALGRALPTLVQRENLELVKVECDAPWVAGKTATATMMKMSTHQLRTKYVATGEASGADIDGYCEFASDPDCWAIYYATMRVVAKQGKSIST